MDKSASTICESQQEIWSGVANSAWNLNGAMGLLHSMNTLRTTLLLEGLTESGIITNKEGTRPLEGVRILDIGCGVGFWSEALAQLGANVTGVDSVMENIKAAEAHMAPGMNINYDCTTVEDYLRDHPGAQFDAVVASEVIEHVENPELFVSCASKLIKVGGIFFVTTINRTVFSWCVAILLLEYILGIAEVGTHPYNKLLTPTEVENWFSRASIEPKYLTGQFYNPITKNWFRISSTQVFWVMYGVKKA
ncbi:unnamed protein product [Allacma fusca]|uniref:3-demethylubiquinol 3-O-methyltransferase n=1 Tax=Allacma fusca TaxID=39272 RepID=A0A8J2JP48_9HEXA|nr:unnamed protein product [Allacma fusca]